MSKIYSQSWCDFIKRFHFVENLKMKIAWMMPRWLVYWCTVRVAVHGTTGKYGKQITPQLTMIEALDRWYHHDN